MPKKFDVDITYLDASIVNIFIPWLCDPYIVERQFFLNNSQPHSPIIMILYLESMSVHHTSTSLLSAISKNSEKNSILNFQKQKKTKYKNILINIFTNWIQNIKKNKQKKYQRSWTYYIYIQEFLIKRIASERTIIKTQRNLRYSLSI